MQWLRSATRWVQSLDVDCDWRSEKVSGRILVVHLCAAAAGVCAAFLTWLFQGDVDAVKLYVCEAAIVIMFLASVILLRQIRRKHFLVFQLIEVLTWLTATTIIAVGLASVADDVTRVRGFFLTLLVGFCGPIFVCMRMPLFLPYAVVLLAVQTVLLEVAEVAHGAEILGTAICSNICVAIVCIALAVSHASVCSMLSNKKSEYKLEQGDTSFTMASLLCDAWCMLDEDGERISQVDEKFEALIGGGLVGSSISDCLSKVDDSAFEKESFSRLVQKVPEGVIVPATFVDHQQRPLQATVCMARHVPAKQEATSGCGIWVGIFKVVKEQASHSEMLDGPQGSSQNAEGDEQALHAGCAEASRCTENCFRLDADKTIEAALTEICDLGGREHWLIDPEEIALYRKGTVGIGAFGAVLLGTFHGAPVVVKVVRESASQVNSKAFQSLCHELRILRHCRHPNLVHFKGAVCDVYRRQVGLVLEYVNGGDLNAWMVKRPNEAARYRLMVGVCRGLWHLHAHKPAVVHGDLKSQNVLVSVTGNDVKAKLTDFGLSILQNQDARQRGGTVRWMSPETFQRQVPALTEADMFSNGRLMQYLALEKMPLDDVPMDVLRGQLLQGIVQLPTWPTPLTPLQRCCQPLVEKCLLVDWTLRPTAADLHGLLAQLPTREFDDEANTATRTSMEMTGLVPWKAALVQRGRPANDQESRLKVVL